MKVELERVKNGWVVRLATATYVYPDYNLEGKPQDLHVELPGVTQSYILTVRRS